MPRRARRKQSARSIVNCDLELKPLMNVFIVLIPMLLMSAVFMEIRVIEMTLPRVAATQHAALEPFDLAIHIRPNAYIVELNGGLIIAIPRHGLANGPGVPGESSSAQLSRVLTQVVAAHPGHEEIRIIAEATTRYQEIVAVMDLARAAGLPRAALEGTEIEGA